MNDRSLRYAKLMKTMGLPRESDIQRPMPESQPMLPEKEEALSGMEHPDLNKKRQMLMLLDSKIAQLEQSDDPNALESLNFWKQKKAELGMD